MMSNEQALSLVSVWLGRAREKHPEYASGTMEAFSVVCEEFFEFKRAIDQESPERQREEALDIVVTALRFVIGEHEKDAR